MVLDIFVGWLQTTLDFGIHALGQCFFLQTHSFSAEAMARALDAPFHLISKTLEQIGT